MKVIFLVLVSLFSFIEKRSAEAKSTADSWSSEVLSHYERLILSHYPGLTYLSDKIGIQAEVEDEQEIKKEKPEDEKNEVPDSFYILTLIVIVILAYLMNKRKPLMNP